jgi:hypothetical protein
MPVDTTGSHNAASGVDFFRGYRQVFTQHDNYAIFDANIALKGICCRGHACVANH